MASLTSVGAKNFHTHAMDGLFFANVAIEFASLGWEGEKNGLIQSKLHLYALAIEVAFKSLALRSGATLEECKVASHRVSRQIELVEKHGVVVPNELKKRLSDDKWFHKMLFMTRYPEVMRAPMNFENTLFFRSKTPTMLETLITASQNKMTGHERFSGKKSALVIFPWYVGLSTVNGSKKVSKINPPACIATSHHSIS